MSMISKIFKSYKDSLQSSITRYETAYASNAENAYNFYNDFLKNLFIEYGSLYSKPHTSGRIVSKIEEYFDKREIPFVAIDGTCSNDPFDDFMVFFAAAYGVRGKILIEPNPPKLFYEKWSMDQDVSLVAYVPIPYAEAGDIIDNKHQEEFVVDDTTKINLSNIHTRLMQLSEIYLAYEMARAPPATCPRLILMDLSLSSVLMSTDVGIENIHLFGHQIGRRVLKQEDGLIVYSHPFNKKLGIPSSKKYRRWSYLVHEITNNGCRPIHLEKVEKDTNIKRADWIRSINEPNSKKLLDLKEDGFIYPKFDFNESWFESKRTFEYFCDNLFRKRDPDALIYPIKEEGVTRNRWVSPEDLAFLISIGLRALIEECWSKKIMLLSIAKDSSTKYFSRNYIGIMRELNVFPNNPVGTLPWTDRTLLESISYKVDELSSPWAITEFDSAYMSLQLEDIDCNKTIRGNRGFIISQERLFARSLAQFLRVKLKSKPLMGHVIFLDRLIDPTLDADSLSGPIIKTDELGTIQPAFFGLNDRINYGQAIEIWLLNVLTRNLFPEVIGYPDPLHKADWGAKSVKRRVDKLIKSSEIVFKSRPLSRTVRTIRDSARR